MKKSVFYSSYSLIFVSFVILMQSCSTSNDVASNGILQKRKYNKGWHFSKNIKLNDLKILEARSEQSVKITKESTIDLTVKDISGMDQKYSVPEQKLAIRKATNSRGILKTIKQSALKPARNKAENCDIIILKNGEEIEAQVLEVGTSDIKYKMCDNIQGPSFTKNISEIFMIKYPNGTKTVFDGNTQNNNTNANENDQLDEDDYLNTIGSDDKSIVVAGLLWFFLGMIGIHRFYLGHIGIGILYLLTAGLCGIGWLIDGILLLTGGLKPKRGDYIDL